MTRTFWVIVLLCVSACGAADEPMRSVTVSGTGSATATPDQATLRMSIVAREPALAAAQAAAGKVAARILELTDRLGIEREDVDTTGASVRPDYQWDRDNNQQVLRGYIAERRMRVDIDELDKLGPLTEGAVAAGVNQLQPPELDSSQRRDAYRRALQAAAEDAAANARALADSLGAGLGEVVSINAGPGTGQPPPQPMRSAMMMSAEADAAPTYNPGELSFTANITVVFALRD